VKKPSAEFYRILKFIGDFDDHRRDNWEIYIALPTIKNPRWFVPIQNKSVVISSLALYQPSLLRAKFLKQLAILTARIGFSSLFLRDKIYFRKNDEAVREIFKQEDLYYAVFTGTAGSHRKVTVQVMDKNGKILGYIKVSDNGEIGKLLENEAEILGALLRLEIGNGLLPRVLYFEDVKNTKILILDTFKSRNSKFSSRLSTPHIEFLAELFQKTSAVKEFKESDFFVRLRSRLKRLESYSPNVWKQRSIAALNYLHKNIGNELIPFCLCHRDFTPWNTFFHHGKLFVFDWEYAEEEYPPLVDVLHFIVQDGILVRHLKPEQLLKRISKNQRIIDKYCEWIGLEKNLLHPLLLCYLLDISLLYIDREKGKVEGEIKHKIETWGEMIDLVLKI